MVVHLGMTGQLSVVPTATSDGVSSDHYVRACWHLDDRKQRIKTQLLGQRLVAGVGHIYADEALFRAGINPAVRSITRKQAHRLLEQLREVLLEAIHRGGTTLRDYRNLQGEGSNQHYLLCYGRSGQPCLLCGTILRSRVIDARTTTWCPDCQRR